MSDAQYFEDLVQIPTLIAQDIVSTAPVLDGINGAYIASQLSEITYESQTCGPDLMTLTLNDPDWIIQTSGLCNVDSEGFLPPVDFNFPTGTDVWWRLNEVTGQGADLSTAGLQLVFQHRLVSYLQEDFGPLKVAPDTMTQAQFFKQLCDRIPTALRGLTTSNGYPLLGPGSQRAQQIQFICPEINVLQPVASTSSSTNGANSSAQVNAIGGIGYGVTLTSGGVQLTNGQIDVANAALRACDQQNASTTVRVAIIYAGMGESNLGKGTGGVNVWQSESEPAAATSQEATDWLTGRAGSGFRGGIAIAQQNPNYAAWQVANACEANAVWNASHTDSYGPHLGGTSAGIAEATDIVTAYGGGSPSNTGGSASSALESAIGELTRGTQDNPDEDSWTCMQRLAGAVNWELYTSAHPAEGQWSNFLYYRTGPNDMGKMPSAYITRSASNPGTWDLTSATKTDVMTTTNALTIQPQYTVDNTAWIYSTTKKRRGRVQRKTKITKPQSPTQIQCNVVTTPMSYSAGDVIVFENSGPINGRWILTDSTRNILLDDFDQWTLEPPSAPNAQPAATKTKKTTSTTTTAASGTLDAVAELAQRAASLEASRHCYSYTQGSGRTNNGNGVLSPPYTFDCSGFCEACYRFAGLSDPAGDTNYAGTSYDIQDSPACAQISAGSAVPGDLVVFPDHVVIYIGDGNCVSMGQQGEPAVTSVASEAAYNGRGITGYYHLRAA